MRMVPTPKAEVPGTNFTRNKKLQHKRAIMFMRAQRRDATMQQPQCVVWSGIPQIPSMLPEDVRTSRATSGHRAVQRGLAQPRFPSYSSTFEQVGQLKSADGQAQVDTVEEMPEEDDSPQSHFPTIQGKENRTGLPDHLKAQIEQLSGEDLSGVRVHYNSKEPKRLNAEAFTKWQDIYLAKGQEKHLPHEAYHVVQQLQGRVHKTTQVNDVAINDDMKLEQEADRMAAKAIQTAPQKTTGASASHGDIDIRGPSKGGAYSVFPSAPVQRVKIKNEQKDVTVIYAELLRLMKSNTNLQVRSSTNPQADRILQSLNILENKDPSRNFGSYPELLNCLVHEIGPTIPIHGSEEKADNAPLGGGSWKPWMWLGTVLTAMAGAYLGAGQVLPGMLMDPKFDNTLHGTAWNQLSYTNPTMAHYSPIHNVLHTVSRQEFAVMVKHYPYSYGITAPLALLSVYMPIGDAVSQHWEGDQKGNAVRHVVWIINAYRFSNGNDDFARELGEAHEQGRPGDAFDEVADKLNNAIALRVAKTMHSKNALAIAEKLWKDGVLARNGDGTNIVEFIKAEVKAGRSISPAVLSKNIDFVNMASSWVNATEYLKSINVPIPVFDRKCTEALQHATNTIEFIKLNKNSGSRKKNKKK